MDLLQFFLLRYCFSKVNLLSKMEMPVIGVKKNKRNKNGQRKKREKNVMTTAMDEEREDDEEAEEAVQI